MNFDFDHDVLKKIEEVNPAAAMELRKAAELYSAGYFTEAAVRMGRAAEASLYGAAREMEISLNKLAIKELTAVQDFIEQTEGEIIRKPTTTEGIKRLATASQKLSQAIAILAEDKGRREGKETDRERSTQRLLKDLKEQVSEDMRRRLEVLANDLQEIQKTRNHGAHASPDGNVRELNSDELNRLLYKVETFCDAVTDLHIGQRASKTFGERSANV